MPAATQYCCLITRGLAEEILMTAPKVAPPAPHCLPAQESPSSALAVGWRVPPMHNLLSPFCGRALDGTQSHPWEGPELTADVGASKEGQAAAGLLETAGDSTPGRGPRAGR